MDGQAYLEDILRVLADLKKRVSTLEEKLENYNVEEKIRIELKQYGLIERSAEDE